MMSTSVPLGTPCGHADAAAVPRALLTKVMISSTVTAPLPSQSPTHRPAVEVGDTVGVGGRVGVGVSVAVAEGVNVVQRRLPVQDAPSTAAHPPHVPTTGGAQK